MDGDIAQGLKDQQVNDHAAATSGVAPSIRDVARNSLVNGTPSANAAFNLTGSPAMSVPAGFGADGLALSVQIVGRNFDEFSIYRAAQIIEDGISCRGIRPDAATNAGLPALENGDEL